MDKTKERYEKLRKIMTPCSKDLYFKDEIQGEMSELKKIIVNCTYNEEHAENMKLGLSDVVKHLEEKNEERGNIADDYLVRLEKGCKEFNTILGREIAGNSGEIQTFRSLETLKSNHIIFKNLELNIGYNRGELDAVVITSKAIFLIEVKNSSHDMVIDSKGNYFRARGYMTLDYNIGEKVNNKEYLLRNALEEELRKAGKKIKIENYVVFANSKISVANKYKYLKTCFLSQLPHLIDDYEGEDIYETEDLELIKATVSAAENKKAYPLNMDIEQLKADFAMAMALLEVTVVEETENEMDAVEIKPDIKNNFVRFVSNKAVQYIGTAAAVAITIATVSVISRKDRRN